MGERPFISPTTGTNVLQIHLQPGVAPPPAFSEDDDKCKTRVALNGPTTDKPVALGIQIE